MADRDTPRSYYESLVNLVERVEAAENPEQALLNLTVERVSRTDPELAEAIRYCAIPRVFDATVIGTIRGTPDDHETNERLLNDLLSFDFVRARKDGGYVYHDNVRDVLLEDWRADDEKRALLNQVNQRLVAFYEVRHEEAHRIERDLEAVAQVMRRANPSRFVHLASIVETLVVTPLLEALYHETLRSAQSGYDLFIRKYQEYEDRGRLAVCEWLLDAIRTTMRRLPAGDEQVPLLGWLDYWKARLMLELRQYDGSELALRSLLTRIELDAQLKLWVLNDLGRILQQRSKLREAHEMYETAVALVRETPEDQHNLPLYCIQLASVYWELDELDQAANTYREAIQSAHETYSTMEAFARADLSGVLQARGEWAEAFDIALEALHLARTQWPSDRSIYQAILERFMFLLARRAPRLLDTLIAKLNALLPAMGDPLQRFDSNLQYVDLLMLGRPQDGESKEGPEGKAESPEPLLLTRRLQHVDLLRGSGQLERAEDFLIGLYSAAADYVDTPFGVNMLLSQASLREDQGRLIEAIELYTQIIEHTQDGLGTPWDHARALSNRGLHYVQRSRLTEAKPDLQAALVKWEEIGNRKLIALLQCFQASMLRRQGRLAEAQQLLDKALPSLEGTNSTYLASYHRVQGEVYRDQARWSEARQQYHQELTVRISLDEAQSAARSLTELANVAGEQGQWEETARYTAEADKLWRQLSRSAQYRPSKEAKQADRDNARGTQCFLATHLDHRERMYQARDLFHSASEQDPENFWHRLDLAYACAELEEWGEATQAVKVVLENGPEWLQSRILYEHLAEYSFRQADALFRGGDYNEAERIYAENLHWAENRLRPGQLATGWLGWGDSLLTLRQADEAKERYEAGLSAATNAENVIDQAAFHGRLACVAAFQADLRGVVEHSQRSLQLRTQAGQYSAASDLVREWSPLISSIQRHRTLSEGLRVLTDDAALDHDQRRNVMLARLELSMTHPMERSGEIDSAEFVPVVTPIILEADNRFFPQGGETSQVIRMIETDIPLMRERLQTSMGATVPGVRIRGNNDFGEGHYVLMLHEIPLAEGNVPLTGRYCPDADGCRSLGIEGWTVVHPVSEMEGMWLSEPVWQRVERAGLPLLDPYQYMLSHLEALIRHHLATFLGFQEVQELLERWKWELGHDEDRHALLDAALPDDAAWRRLVQVLQELVKEEVPVRDLTAILAAFSDANPRYREVIEVVEIIRMVLRPELPGNEDTQQFIGLSPSFEGAILRGAWERDGNRFLALHPEEVQGLLSAVREHMAGRDTRNVTLVVQEYSLRPFVRRLVERIFPTLPVLADRELAEERTSVSEKIEYTSQLSVTDD